MNIAQQTANALAGLTVDDMEKKLLEYDQVECPVIHRFGPGQYIREVFIPAGSIAIGHYQKQEHMNVFLKGRVSMLNDNGSVTELVAPMIFIGKPGRKVGYIHEDVVWLNIYATEETDVEKLEEKYLNKTEYWKDKTAVDFSALCTEDRNDYALMLGDVGITAQEARSQSENMTDQIPMPMGNYKFCIGNSQIDGRGIFATADIKSGEIIGPSRIGCNRTPLGRFVNHSKTPNATMKMSHGDIYLIAIKDIEGCKGGILGGEIVIDYRNAIKLITQEASCQL